MVRVLLLLICNQLIPLATAAATATGGCGVAHRPTLPPSPLKNQDETNKLLSDTVLVVVVVVLEEEGKESYRRFHLQQTILG